MVVIVPMMSVGEMLVDVGDRIVVMRMGMTNAGRHGTPGMMLVMGVVFMLVLMIHRDMGMSMPVVLGEV